MELWGLKGFTGNIDAEDCWQRVSLWSKGDSLAAYLGCHQFSQYFEGGLGCTQLLLIRKRIQVYTSVEGCPVTN